MVQPNSWRDADIGSARVNVRAGSGGTLYVSSDEPLHPYPDRITDRLVLWAARDGERTFVARRGADGQWVRISYAQMLDRARRAGQALLDRKLSADRPLVILSDNDLEHATLAVAALYAGVPFVPVSPAYSLVSKDFEKLRHIIALVQPGLVFVADSTKFGAAIEATVDPDVEIVSANGSVANRRTTPFDAFLATPATAEVDTANAGVGPDSIAKFLLTSGSTSAPKAVINTHRMLASNQQVIRQCFTFFEQTPPILVDWLPWNHTFGGNHNFGMVLYNGGSLYIDEGKPTPAAFGQTLANLREVSPTIYFNVPRGFEELADALSTDEQLRESFFGALHLMFNAGAGLPDPVAKRLYELARTHCGQAIGIYSGLGMTETAPWAIGVARIGEVPGAIGTPAPGIIVKLVPNSGKLELRYRGPGVTPGYWRQPELTRSAFDEEGFFISGDAVAFVDPADPSKGFRFDGRVAEDFKLNTGTWVSVGPLRARAIAEGAPLVQDAVVTGYGHDELGLLVFPRIDSCRALAGLASNVPSQQVLQSPSVREFFQAYVDRMAALGTGSANRIGRLRILVEPASIDRGEITDKGSINQRAVLTHRAGDVEALYSDSVDVIRPRLPDAVKAR